MDYKSSSIRLNPVRMFAGVVRRDAMMAVRYSSELFYPVLFFTIIVCFYPFAVGPDSSLMIRISPGIIWVTALLATLLALDGIFKSDYDDGYLDQFVLSPYPLSLIICAKIFAHWLVSGFPLCIAGFIFGWLLNLPDSALCALFLSLIIGTPGLSVVGAIGAALTIGIKKSGLLLTLIIMPLYVPVLIFASGAINAGINGLDWTGQIYFLSAIVVLFITLAPIAISHAIRVGLN